MAESRAVEPRMAASTTIVERAGVTLVAQRHGPADAPGILLSHGVASSIQFLSESLVGPFVDAGFRVELMGLPGHDPSSPCTDVDRYALDEVAADLAAMATVVSCSIVGGVSLAGHASVRLAARRLLPRLSALIVCLPAWIGHATAGEGVHARIADDVRTIGVPSMLERLRADTTMAAWLQHTLPRDWARHDAGSVAAALLSLDGGEAPGQDELRSINCPTAIVTWPDDPGHPIEAAQAWHELLPRSAVRETSIDAMQHDRSLFGQLALAGLSEVGVQPPSARGPGLPDFAVGRPPGAAGTEDATTDPTTGAMP